MKFLRTAFRLTTFAAAAYGGYAAFTFLRYGRPKKRNEPSTLDRFMPDPEVIEQHSIIVHAPADVTYRAACQYDVMHSRIAHLLFDTRALAMGTKPVHADLPQALVEQMKAVGWEVLEETKGQEIVFGVAAQPWIADAGFRTIPAAEFATFQEPGWAKIIVNLSTESVGDHALLRTETRVITTDARARKRFRKYWAFVNPGAKLILIGLLRGVKSNAEATVQKTVRSAASAA